MGAGDKVLIAGAAVVLGVFIFVYAFESAKSSAGEAINTIGRAAVQGAKYASGYTGDYQQNVIDRATEEVQTAAAASEVGEGSLAGALEGGE